LPTIQAGAPLWAIKRQLDHQHSSRDGEPRVAPQPTVPAGRRHLVVNRPGASTTAPAQEVTELVIRWRWLTGHLGLASRVGTPLAYLACYFSQAPVRSASQQPLHHQPTQRPARKLEVAYHKPDHAIQQMVDLLVAA
jgi:hypothetical protein